MPDGFILQQRMHSKSQRINLHVLNVCFKVTCFYIIILVMFDEQAAVVNQIKNMKQLVNYYKFFEEQ